VLAHDHDGSAVVGQDGWSGGHELEGQEQRARDVAELVVLAGRAHVEDHGAESEEALGLLRGDVLIRARAAIGSDGKRGHGDHMIG